MVELLGGEVEVKGTIEGGGGGKHLAHPGAALGPFVTDHDHAALGGPKGL